MRIVIFHYHLNPGGVTRIVESQVEAIKSICPSQEILVVTGDCADDSVFKHFEVELLVKPELNYLTDTDNIQLQFKRISSFLSETLRPDDILHIHNLNLGKNPLVTMALSQLAKNGAKVINHAHDFAEDRPFNLKFLKDIIEGKLEASLSEVLYPEIENYRFVTLNSHDLKRLTSYGVDTKRCDMLANPVVFNSTEKDGDTAECKSEVVADLQLPADKLMVTYPVRVIRRKNIAEFILLAVLFSDEANWIVTQPPQNPIEQEYYYAWKDFCQREGIQICWEAGNKTNFEKLIRSSDFCISTSIQEGFGMVFMEPWLLGTAVIGRNIPMVTIDMLDSGMNFPGLYNRFEVSKQKELHEFDIDTQMNIIRNILSSDVDKEALIAKNTWVRNLLLPPNKELIETNKSVILNKFSLSNYGELLNEVYRKIIK